MTERKPPNMQIGDSNYNTVRPMTDDEQEEVYKELKSYKKPEIKKPNWVNILCVVDDRHWISVATSICSNYCSDNTLTVYISEVTVITPNRTKIGVCVTFPANINHTTEQVEELAIWLKRGLYQQNVTIETPDKTYEI